MQSLSPHAITALYATLAALGFEYGRTVQGLPMEELMTASILNRHFLLGGACSRCAADRHTTCTVLCLFLLCLFQTEIVHSLVVGLPWLQVCLSYESPDKIVKGLDLKPLFPLKVDICIACRVRLGTGTRWQPSSQVQ